MDRDVALELLKGGKEGIAEWNRRRGGGDEIPDLSFLDFRHTDLSGANLGRAKLSGVNLTGASLNDADVRWADISRADVSRANLSGANLGRVNLRHATLRDADLNGADLGAADLSAADLCRADLTGADLSGAYFCSAKLGDANLSEVSCYFTIFANVDLSEPHGLDSVLHIGPSTLGTDTLLLLKENIPKVLLRGCGLPESLIQSLPLILNSMQPIQFYSCFISYSTADEEFATRLHNDFQAAGIRCWKWDHDARTGRSLWGEIDQAIRLYDKLSELTLGQSVPRASNLRCCSLARATRRPRASAYSFPSRRNGVGPGPTPLAVITHVHRHVHVLDEVNEE